MANEKLPAIRKAADLDISFPDNDKLEEKEKKPIKSAVLNGGLVAPDGRCYVENNEVHKILVTDKKGGAKIINNAPEEDKYENGNKGYLASSEVRKVIDERMQEPRSTLEHERLTYADNCLVAFRDASDLVKERHIEADRIQRDRAALTDKKIRDENIQECQLSGQPFEKDARGHHIERVVDKPRKARESDNIIVMKNPIHLAVHENDAETPETLKKFIEKNGYNKPNNLK